MKRTNIYKANNVTFDPQTCTAVSYNWWTFVKRIDGLVIFNNYFYSPCTSKHQSKVRGLLHDLGIKIDAAMPIPKGLQDRSSLEELILEAEEYECDKILKNIIKAQDKYQERKELKTRQEQALVMHAAHEGQETQMRMLSLVVN